MKRNRMLVLCIVTALAAVGTAAQAHLLEHSDPDDTKGRLDLRRAAVARDGDEIDVKVRTYEKIRDRDLLDGGFLVQFDSRGGRRADFSLRMDLYEGGRPWCTLYDRDGFSRYETEATRTRRSFACTFPKAELEASKHVRWRARTGEGAAREQAPDKGWYRH